MQNYYELVDANKRKSTLILILFVLFISLSVSTMMYAFDFGLGFIGIALIFTGIMSFASYYYSDKIILGISGAKPATRKDYFNYYTVTENLCIAAQIPMPKLYVIKDTSMNAFATGRDPEHAVVCATTGILNRLDRTELEGVVAHELSHIRNYDIRLMSIVTVLIGIVALLADWFLRISIIGGKGRSKGKDGQMGAIIMAVGLVLVILSPIIANLIKLAISRRREFLADASSAALTKYPEGLARALEKLSQDKEPLEAANKATAHLYISNPLKNHRDAIGWFSNMFNTHPPIADRIAALRS